MTQKHTLLLRQLRKHFPNGAPPDATEFVEAVHRAYQQFDDDRMMLERSLELSSRELMQANSEMRAIFEAVPDLFFRIASDGRVLDVKAGDHSYLQMPAAQLVGRQIQSIPVGDAGAKFTEAVRSAAERRVMTSIEYSIPRNGIIDYFEARLVPLPGSDELVVVVRNITERKRAEDEIKHGMSVLQSTFESTADGILVVDLKGRIVSFNQRFASMWGLSPELLETRNDEVTLSHALHQLKDPDQYLDKVRELYSDVQAESFDVVELIDGRLFERYSIPQRIDGVPVGRVWSFRDVTARKRAEEQLVHDAIHDALTGLPNRTLFLDRLEQAIRRSKRHIHHRFALLFVDLDRFKVVNDSLGHLAGDELLIAVSQRLRNCIRPGDTVARLGGDEFTVLLDEIDQPGDAVRAAERIQAIVSAPIIVRGAEIFMTVSIGIATSAPHYTEPDELLRDADIAMYRAKARGRAGHEMFHPGMHTRAVALLQIENDLRRAVERQELVLHYQPVVNLHTSRILGFEALMRWPHPQRGLVYPDEFIGIAEETGLIVPIGRWALREACTRMRAWQRKFERYDLTLAVNISGRQLVHASFAAELETVLRETFMPPHLLALEITETVLMEKSPSAAHILGRIRALGVKIHIDDFGTGYSSLSYLHRLPIDALKIDRSFISHVETGDENVEIVRTIVTLAENLKLGVIAEGVENDAQRIRLVELGCEAAQGHFFSMAADPLAVQTMIGSGHYSGRALNSMPHLHIPPPH